MMHNVTSGLVTKTVTVEKSTMERVTATSSDSACLLSFYQRVNHCSPQCNITGILLRSGWLFRLQGARLLLTPPDISSEFFRPGMQEPLLVNRMNLDCALWTFFARGINDGVENLQALCLDWNRESLCVPVYVCRIIIEPSEYPWRWQFRVHQVAFHAQIQPVHSG